MICFQAVSSLSFESCWETTRTTARIAKNTATKITTEIEMPNLEALHALVSFREPKNIVFQ